MKSSKHCDVTWIKPGTQLRVCKAASVTELTAVLPCPICIKNCLVGLQASLCCFDRNGCRSVQFRELAGQKGSAAETWQ